MELSINSSVDNFTITICSVDGTTDLGTVAPSPLKHVTLNYNTNYTISVRASNCAGSSIPGVILFIECECRFQIVYFTLCTFDYNYFPIIIFLSAGCPPPGQPVSGSVSGFTSARVGSEVTYHCDEGLNLVGERVAVCTLRLVWDPMGSEVMCAPPASGKVSSMAGLCIASWSCYCWSYIGDCGDFGVLTNGTVLFSNGTADGSLITFQCAIGFSLVGDRVSQCRSGQWTVQPQDVQCTPHPPTSQGVHDESRANNYFTLLLLYINNILCFS